MASPSSRTVAWAAFLMFFVAFSSAAVVPSRREGPLPEEPVSTGKFGNLRTEADRMKQKISAMQVNGALKLKTLRGELMGTLHAKDQANRDVGSSNAFLKSQIDELKRNGTKLVRQQVGLLNNLTSKREILLMIQSKLQVALDYTELVIKRSQNSGTATPLNWSSQLQILESTHAPVKQRKVLVMAQFPNVSLRQASLLAKGATIKKSAPRNMSEPRTNPSGAKTLAERKIVAKTSTSIGATQHAKNALEMLQQGLQTLEQKQGEAEAKLRAGFEERVRFLDLNKTELEDELFDLVGKKVSYTKLNEDLVTNVTMLEARSLKVKHRSRGIARVLKNMTDNLLR